MFLTLIYKKETFVNASCCRLACLPFVRREHEIQWSPRQQGYGVTVAPAYRYKTTRTLASHEWIPNEIRVIEGPFELFYGTQNYWYYAGTYTTTGIQSKKKGFFEMLQPTVSTSLFCYSQIC